MLGMAFQIFLMKKINIELNTYGLICFSFLEQNCILLDLGHLIEVIHPFSVKIIPAYGNTKGPQIHYASG